MVQKCWLFISTIIVASFERTHFLGFVMKQLVALFLLLLLLHTLFLSYISEDIQCDVK